MRTTLKDIAADTGFSLTSVSLVLNNKDCNIPESTRQVILDAAKRLNYRPNKLALGLVQQRTDTIACIVSDIRNTFFATLAKGVEDVCRESNRTMILCNTNNLHAEDLNYINVLVDRGVDGIVYGMSGDTDLAKATECCRLMERQEMPFVMVDRYFEKLDYPVVKVDHVTGGYLAAKHLINMGHQRIACITGPAVLDDVADRLRGYRQALAEAKIPYRREYIYEGRYTEESGAAGYDWFEATGCTAVFAFNDMMAFGVYQRAKQKGRSFPADFSLVGYDDIFFSALMEAPLSTVHQPVYEMGRKAAEKLLRIIDGEKIEQQDVFRPELISRASVKRL